MIMACACEAWAPVPNLAVVRMPCRGSKLQVMSEGFLQGFLGVCTGLSWFRVVCSKRFHKFFISIEEFDPKFMIAFCRVYICMSMVLIWVLEFREAPMQF